jgi:hypothetical protein
METPTMWAAGLPTASSTAAASAAMSRTKYLSPSLSQVDRPTSRLSKRMANSPLSTRSAQKASGQRVICEPRPLISSTASFLESPNVSYSMATAPD